MTEVLYAVTPEQVNSWFTPFHYFTYLFCIVVIMYITSQIQWTNIAAKNIKVLVVRSSGGGDPFFIPKSGNSVVIKNEKTGETRTWPINELATIDVPYPDIGFVPRWMLKNIKMAIIDEEDWEPLLNRSPHRKKVMSPDVIDALKSIADSEKIGGNFKKVITALLDGASTAPTRAMIANPAVIGNLMQSGVLQAIAMVSREMTDSLKAVINKLQNMPNPLIFYIGMGLSVLLLVFVVFKVVPAMEEIIIMGEKLDLIMKSLGAAGVRGLK